MFEKEVLEIAKDIYIHHFDDDVKYPDVLNAIIIGTQRGTEFGFQKGIKAKINTATISDCPIKDEWHYVKDELPRKSDSTLCELMPVFVAVKVGFQVSTYGTYWNLRLGKFECLDEVYAWCYTPEPPELPKETE